MASRREINWETLDKQKFFVYGASLFTGLTTALYPLSVVKTRMMALDDVTHRGLSGAFFTARDVVRTDGVRGLYRGYSVVLSAMIPARMVYLGALELSKSAATTTLHKYSNMSSTAIAGTASLIAGASASLGGQLIFVPVDVVSQRLMIQDKRPGTSTSNTNSVGGQTTLKAAGATTMNNNTTTSSAHRLGGFQLARNIVRTEGIRGLYRGFGASVVTFVPSSSIWWASYGAWQSFLWHHTNNTSETASEAEILGVQAVSGVLTGVTSAFLTNPLDVVKTRLQTADIPQDGKKPTWLQTARKLAHTDGVKGFYRGVPARMTSTAIWGTSMVTAYEFLKRLCQVKPETGI